MSGAAAGRTAAALLFVPAACSPAPGNSAAQVDIANAAVTPHVNPIAKASPAAVIAPAAPAAINAAPAAPPAADAAEGAADVVQRYFAAIEAGRYRDAWAMWDDDGRAAGLSADAFAASFDKYGDYHAEVGTPGRINAGAGQRYVSVPVTISGRLKDGGDVAMTGEITLHRAADIDGATAAQRSWRISASDLKPRP